MTPPGYVTLQTMTVPLSGAASIAVWIELYLACLHDLSILLADPFGET